MLGKDHLLKPAFMKICKANDIQVTYTAPYTSSLCCIEFKWQDGNCWTAQPRNQRLGRTCAKVVKLVRQKWYEQTPDQKMAT